VVQDGTRDPAAGAAPAPDEVVAADRGGADAGTVDDGGVLREEEQLLAVVQRHLDRVIGDGGPITDYDRELLALRDEIAEAKPEDVGPLVETMHRVAALARQHGRGAALAVDRSSPYFGHLRLDEGGRRRDVLIGKRTYIAPGGGVRIVDWRNAPVSRLFYQYREGEDYRERFGGREVQGIVDARRTVSIIDGALRRVSSGEETWVRGEDGRWRALAAERWQLRGGGGSAARPAPLLPVTERARLGTRPGLLRADKHLPDIAALIDPEQFALITRPDSGLVVIQGVAGSGKTTVGLHRMAWLAFQEPNRYRPDAMRAIVYSRALRDYISRVLPGLGVEGVPVTTWTDWALQLRRNIVKGLPERSAPETPAVVSRLKKHPAMLAILADAVARRADALTARLRAAFEGSPDAELVLGAWKATADRRLLERALWLGEWLERRRLLPGVKRKKLTRGAEVVLGHLLPRLIEDAGDIVSVWEELVTDLETLRVAFALHAPGAFRDSELKRAHAWSVRQFSVRTSESQEDDSGEPAALDAEDDTLLLRLQQLQRGPLQSRGKRLRLAHLFVDEAQDLSPVELAVLLDVVDPRRCVTLAGDTAQRMHADNGFESWDAVLAALGLAGLAVSPLRVAYRSTAEIMSFARQVLGPLADPTDRYETTRQGAPVELLRFSDHGEAVAFLAESLRNVVTSEPNANVALVARDPALADLYFAGLEKAEVPRLRRVRDQDFSFAPGVEVTDVYQVKGLEFDYVLLLECTAERYPLTDESRYLLHIGATRAAHQLWLTAAERPSPVLPEGLSGGLG
jgi:DNA helicase-2/ATP-dependent DNA helicase PcrA